MSFLIRTYPSTWRINDWHDPWLPLPIRLLNRLPRGLVKRLFPLEEASLMARAQKATKLTHFGDPDFLTPFRILLKDLHEHDYFTVMGHLTAHTMFSRQLQARLCLEEKIRTAPELLQQPVERPVIIAGLPRTGTTHLHNLLSEVRGLRYMPLWQTLQPVAPPAGVPDRRRQTSDFYMDVMRYCTPLFVRMHEMETDLCHEELTISALCFRSFMFEGAFEVPGYRAWYAANTHEKGYEYLKQTLQILQSEPAVGDKVPGARWILKSPQHLDQLETILKVFPDAKLLLTYRDPVQVVLSMATMMLYLSRQMYKPIRLREAAQAWVDRLEQMLRDSQAQAARIPRSQLFPVPFQRLMAEPEAMLEDIATFAGLELDPASRKAITTHLKSHGRNRHGKIEYHFEDLGLREGEVRERFQFYTNTVG